MGIRKLSEAQQSLLDKVTGGAQLRFVGESGLYRLKEEARERTVFPNTVQSLLKAGHLSMDLSGRCVLSTSNAANQTFDGTPPPDFPAQVVIMDRAFARRHPAKGFYLRIGTPQGHVETVRLDNEATPVGARRAAEALGYHPTHWLDVGDGILCTF